MFLRDLAVRHEAGGYLFVHAGIRPGVPLDRQSRHDLLWIREPFLSSEEHVRPRRRARPHARSRNRWCARTVSASIPAPSWAAC